MRVRGLDHELAAARHRVARVDGEIEDHVFDLRGIDQRRPQAVAERKLDRDILAERALQDRGGARDDLVEVDVARLQRLLAREGEHALGELRAARGRFVDRLHDRRELRILPDRIRQQLGHADDDGQQIVEIVRDAAGHLPDRFHLLRLAQLPFQHQALGHVAADEEILPVRLGPDPGPGDRHRVTVLVQVAAFERARERAAARAPHFVARALQIVGENEVRRAASVHVFRRMAEDRARARAHAHEVAALADHEDEVERGVEDALIDRADRRSFALALLDDAGAAALLVRRTEQDGVAAGMRIAAHLDPRAEKLRIAREGDRLVVGFRRRVDQAERIVRADVERLVNRLADKGVRRAAPQPFAGRIEVDDPPVVIDRDDAVGDARQHGGGADNSISIGIGAENGHGGIVAGVRDSGVADRARSALIVHRITPPANDPPPCCAGLPPFAAASSTRPRQSLTLT